MRLHDICLSCGHRKDEHSPDGTGDTTIYVLAEDIEQPSCNMVPTLKIEIGRFFSIYVISQFFNLYLNILKNMSEMTDAE